jgi:hypothetical protein
MASDAIIRHEAGPAVGSRLPRPGIRHWAIYLGQERWEMPRKLGESGVEFTY